MDFNPSPAYLPTVVSVVTCGILGGSTAPLLDAAPGTMSGGASRWLGETSVIASVPPAGVASARQTLEAGEVSGIETFAERDRRRRAFCYFHRHSNGR